MKRIVHVSTCGANDWRRLLDGAITGGFPLGPGRAYGNFKVAKEIILEAFAAQFRIELVIRHSADRPPASLASRSPKRAQERPTAARAERRVPMRRCSRRPSMSAGR